MAVEIHILSGVRQGEQLVLDAREFRVGSDPKHEVFFDARHDKDIRGRSAWFCLQEDGWRIRATGGKVLVNQQTVEGWTRVRSGDVVRMSESGPDFSFRIVAKAAASPARRAEDDGMLSIAAAEPAAPRDAETAAPVASARPRQAPSVFEVPEPAVSLAAAPVSVQFPSSNPPAITDRRRAGWIVGGLAIGILSLFALKSFFTSPTIVVTVTSPNQAESSGEPRAAGVDLKQPAVRETAEASGSESKLSASEPRNEQKTADRERQSADVASQLEKSVFLLQVEKSGHCWPFATCTAIGDDTLLTSGREALQLATWQARDGFKIWVTQGDEFKEEVRDIRINAAFESLAQKPNDWIYFDVGLVTVQVKLPKVASLASPEECAGLEEGTPVTCLGFAHEGEKTTRFDHFEPRPARGKVYVITVSAELPGRPRLLHVRADIPKFAYGSPVVNEEGRVLGVYGEAAVLPSGANAAAGKPEIKNMHYVALVNAEMVERWLRDRDASTWPPAASPPSVETMQGNP
jgi:hypothetical protein